MVPLLCVGVSMDMVISALSSILINFLPRIIFQLLFVGHVSHLMSPVESNCSVDGGASLQLPLTCVLFHMSSFVSCNLHVEVALVTDHQSGAHSFMLVAEKPSGYGKAACVKKVTPPSIRNSDYLRASLAAVVPPLLQALQPWPARPSSPYQQSRPGYFNAPARLDLHGFTC